MTRPIRSGLSIAVLGVVLALGGTSAFADISLVSQTRSVSGTGNGVTNTQTAPDFAPFHGNVFAGGSGLSDSNGRARQDSTLTNSQFSYSASVEAYHVSGHANSTFQIVFDVAAPQTYDAVLIRQDFFSFFTAELIGPGGTVFSHNSDFTAHFGGTLTAGRYTLSSNIDTSGIGSNFDQFNRGSFSISFVPAPASTALLFAGASAAARRRR